MRHIAVALLLLSALGAQTLGTVRGVVHDPQHRPTAHAQVTLKAANSQYTRTTESNDVGEFAFTGVPIGDYAVTAQAGGFQPVTVAFTLVSDTTPILHLQLSVAALVQTQEVTAEAGTGALSYTPTTLVDRLTIQDTPGADQTNSMAMITDFTPGAYLTHDMLHIRGGHQTSWLIDGVELPQLNIGSNLAPQIDPKDIDYLEVMRGSYPAEYGDRTYGEFNVVPRSGFETNGDAELTSSFGSFYQTDDQLTYGNHNQRFAYYVSLDGNRSNLGLETPVAQVYHDAENGAGVFTSLLFNQSASNQLRFDGQIERDYYQIPYDPNPNDFENSQFQTAGLRDHQVESDAFAILSWVHTFNPDAVITVSPFYHRNNAVYGSPDTDTPLATNYGLLSNYAGGQTSFSLHVPENEIDTGLYAYDATQDENFGLIFNDGSGLPPLSEQDHVNGNEEAIYFNDSFNPLKLLTLSAGLRYTHFGSEVIENTTYPRLGATLRLPGTPVTLHGFWGKFYQPPPLISLSGPLLSYLSTISTPASPTSFAPLHGERDEEHQVGFSVPIRGWEIDADNFDTRGVNFLDHNNIGESDIFIPVTVAQSRVIGNEATLRSPRLWKRTQVHVAYSNQIAESQSAFTGGLIVGLPPAPGWSLLDHDQRNTANVGGLFTLPDRITASGNVYYGSGFSNAYPPPAHLPGHSDIDLTLGRDFSDTVSASLTALNVFNNHLLIDDSLTFGGFHYDNPREVYVEVRYRFHPFGRP